MSACRQRLPSGCRQPVHGRRDTMVRDVEACGMDNLAPFDTTRLQPGPQIRRIR